MMNTMEKVDYEKQAADFLARFNLKMTIKEGDGHAPPWSKAAVDGTHYRVKIARTNTKFNGSISFDFWGSVHDAETGRTPTAYDVLACISSDVYMPTTPDEVAEEIGPMPPSQAIAAARFARRLQTMFTDTEQKALAEIQ